MPRLHKPRISPLEDFLNRASRPLRSRLHPYFRCSTPTNNPATALLNLLSKNDVLQLRLVSKSIHDWTDECVDDLFSKLYYTITITDQQNGTLVRTPTALAPLQTIGQLCTHFVIIILDPSPLAVPTSTLTPQRRSTSSSTSTFPKAAFFPQILTRFLIHLLTHLLPALDTLTLSLPDVSPWRPVTTTHSTLVYIRQALELLPTTNLKALFLDPISLAHLVSLRWCGLGVYGGDAGWTGHRFWKGVRVLGVNVYVPMEVKGCRGGNRSQGREKEKEGGGREVREDQVRTGIKVLYDWLASFGQGLEFLAFEWVALPEADADGSGNDYSVYQQERRGAMACDDSSFSTTKQRINNDVTPGYPVPAPASETKPSFLPRGPNPLTFHLNPTLFSITSLHSPKLPGSSNPPSADHQPPTRTPGIPPSTSKSTQITTTPPSTPKGNKGFSHSPIRWAKLREVWLRGVEVGPLATWMADVPSLEWVVVWKDGDEGEVDGGYVAHEDEGMIRRRRMRDRGPDVEEEVFGLGTKGV